ncbi:MAG: DUF2007 domain-containing protein [Cyclobacteriaceae bacterium]|nr:DUF2007 domain-containing protein [Cyclobacteriaceae bacterium]
MKDWTVVYKTPISSRAEIVKSVLYESGIDAVIINKKDSSIHISHGLLEVMVQRERVLEALKIVNDEISFE